MCRFEFLFGSLDVPLANLEASLKNYEPSEEPFNVTSVSREVKSQPFAEKKAAAKKPTGLGAPPAGPTSTVDTYEKLLSAIPEFSTSGQLFKSSAPVELTEAETEYAVNVVKHIFDEHVVFQYNCTNTIPEQLLEDVKAEEFEELATKPLKSLPYDTPGPTFVAFEKPAGVPAVGKFANVLRFNVKEVDTPLVRLRTMVNAWESLGPDFERVDEYGFGPRNSLKEAVSVVISRLGMQPCEGTEVVAANSRSHTCLLSGVYIGNVKVLVCLSFGVDSSKEVAMKLSVRSEDEAFLISPLKYISKTHPVINIIGKKKLMDDSTRQIIDEDQSTVQEVQTQETPTHDVIESDEHDLSDASPYVDSESDDECRRPTPNGRKYRLLDVPIEERPTEGDVFDNFDEAYNMYLEYSQKTRFSIRKSTTKRKNGNITHKYILCSKAEKPKKTIVKDTFVQDNQKEVDQNEGAKISRKNRYSSFTVTDCKAVVRFKAIHGTNCYKLYDFVENHNHPLVEENNLDNLKARPRDAQMLVDKLNDRKKHVPNFSFEYKTVNDELSRMFWADETMKCNYIAFGDVVSFDATYRTNRYRVIFVSFTGIDHNQKSVTFGAGLLSDETFHSYTWLLTAFKQAHGKEPLMAVTDQDATLRNAIEFVFSESHHRDRWIPGYFKDLPMCCLMKTTDERQTRVVIVYSISR
nr:coatomer subunit gamma-2 [Tanacetum cinerariifolium]